MKPVVSDECRRYIFLIMSMVNVVKKKFQRSQEITHRHRAKKLHAGTGHCLPSFVWDMARRNGHKGFQHWIGPELNYDHGNISKAVKGHLPVQMKRYMWEITFTVKVYEQKWTNIMTNSNIANCHTSSGSVCLSVFHCGCLSMCLFVIWQVWHGLSSSYYEATEEQDWHSIILLFSGLLSSSELAVSSSSDSVMSSAAVVSVCSSKDQYNCQCQYIRYHDPEHLQQVCLC